MGTEIAEQFRQSVESSLFEADKIKMPDDGKPLIIVCSNKDQFEILENWLEAMKRAEIDHFLIIALDQKTYKQLDEQGVNTVLLEFDGDIFQGFWEFRVHLFQYLINAGIDFIHSDSDAIWIRDPYPDYLAMHADYDLLISQGLTYPQETFDRLGFVCCCGFFYFRSTAASKKLLDQWTTRMTEEGDDQISLNRLLGDLDVNWDISSPYEIIANETAVKCSKEIITGENKTLKIGVLPMAYFQRDYDKEENPYVVHQFLPKEQVYKKYILNKLGLWFVRFVISKDNHDQLKSLSD